MSQGNDRVTAALTTKLFDVFGIECREALVLGNVRETIYRARRGPRKLVVKLGVGERPAAEVRMNLAGSAAYRAIGAGRLLPDPFAYLELDGVPTLIMEDCGPDLLLSPNDARRLFALGRALQSALSARFRLTTDAERASELARACENHISDFLS